MLQREEIERTRRNSDKDGKVILEDIKNIDPVPKKPGILVLPQKNEARTNTSATAVPSLNTHDHPR